MSDPSSIVEHMFDQRVPEPDQLAGLSASELIDAARACARAENAVCARKLAVMAEIFTRRTALAPDDRESWWVDPEAAVLAELAAAQNITQGLASHQTFRGVALRDRLPKVGALFLAGLISDMLVRTIIWRTYLITDAAVMAAVDAALAGQIVAWGALSAAKTELAIDALVERHDPDAVRTKKDATPGRCVQFGSRVDEPGFTSIWARIYATDAATAERVIKEMAHRVCPDDPRSLEERQAEAYTALLAGIPTLACHCGAEDCEAASGPRPVRDATVYLITDRTTATLDDVAERKPAETPETEPTAEPTAETAAEGDHDVTTSRDLEGPPNLGRQNHVPPDSPHRTIAPKPELKPNMSEGSAYVFGTGLAPTSLLEAMCQDGSTREIVHPGLAGPEPRYAPSQALAEFVRCRDLTCRFPGCDTPATLADIDHTVPHPVGPTHASNLKCLCRFHHLLKTFWAGAGGWRDRQHPDGTVVWTAPTGHTYTTLPGSRLLFPTLCRPTATLWKGQPPTPDIRPNRGAMMPKRRNPRSHNRTRAIYAERRRNQAGRLQLSPDDETESGAYHHGRSDRLPGHGHDPPPF
ncbi:HNH nuclease domain-containing protein [Mycobacterium sp. smrl_JER01]